MFQFGIHTPKSLMLSRKRGSDREDRRNTVSVSIDGSTLEVDNVQHLGAIIQSEGDVSKEIKCRLAIGLKALNGMKTLLQGEDKETKLRVLRACIFQNSNLFL